MGLFRFETYKPDDYVFIDQNGKEYISTPEFDYTPILILTGLIGGFAPFWIGLVLSVLA